MKTVLLPWPDKRRRDLDNLHTSMKAALDGLALAMGCDDSEFCPIEIDQARAK